MVKKQWWISICALCLVGLCACGGSAIENPSQTTQGYVQMTGEGDGTQEPSAATVATAATSAKTQKASTTTAAKATEKSAQSNAASATASTDAVAWNLLLVNNNNWLPENFSVILSKVNDTAYRVDKRILPALKEMLAAAKADGVNLLICSAYRSVEKQESLFQNKVQRVINQYGYSREKAEAVAATAVARPRTSEHHTGLALDIVTPSHQTLDDAYAETAAAKWLKANAAEYGFILRYPRNKERITGVIFEPWHYRYVGKPTAQEIMSRGICLEEYLGQVS